MRRWLLVAVLAWALAAVVQQTVDRADQARQRWGSTDPVLVAEHDLRPGDDLAGAVTVRSWPKALVPPAARRSVPGGARAAVAIDAGTAITDAVVETGTGDRRRVALPQAGARLPVEAGDRVDVWATTDPATSADGAGATRRVASDARVVTASDRGVVLEVRSSQVERLAEAAVTATITLVGAP